MPLAKMRDVLQMLCAAAGGEIDPHAAPQIMQALPTGGSTAARSPAPDPFGAGTAGQGDVGSGIVGMPAIGHLAPGLCCPRAAGEAVKTAYGWTRRPSRVTLALRAFAGARGVLCVGVKAKRLIGLTEVVAPCRSAR